MEELTLEMLKEMRPGTFAKGEIVDCPDGINMTNSGKLLRWVAVRGGIHDWAIYCLFADNSYEEIRRVGDKIHNPKHIRKLVPCTDEAFKMYRY